MPFSLPLLSPLSPLRRCRSRTSRHPATHWSAIALATYKANAPKIAKLFPDDSKTGGETEALPVLWDNKDDVAKRFEKLAADAAAAEGKITDEFSFQEEFPKVAGNCGGCHKQYREKK